MFAHRPGLHTIAISIRNSFRQKSYFAVERNLQALVDQIKDLGPFDSLVELGVGYTPTDILVLKEQLGVRAALVSDVAPLLRPRVYAVVSLLNPLNYLSHGFRKSILLHLEIAVLGLWAMRRHGTYYHVGVPTEAVSPGCLIYSNAVLEHLNDAQIDALLMAVATRPGTCFAGIIDTNDHQQRHLPLAQQFSGYTKDEESIQKRGNRINSAQWCQIIKRHFGEVTIEDHAVDSYSPPLRGIINFVAKSKLNH